MRTRILLAIASIGIVTSLGGVLFLPSGSERPALAASDEADSGMEEEAADEPSASLPMSGTGDIQVPPPPFTEGIFPCMDCHSEIETNPERRVLEEYHDDIVFTHDPENRWCLDCHDAENRDVLRMASGKTLPFEESYKLCGQCHGPKLRDWKAGVHGRRTGRWDGKERFYLLCVNCHNPHSPKFPKIHALPTPIPPAHLIESLSLPYEAVDLEQLIAQPTSSSTQEE